MYFLRCLFSLFHKQGSGVVQVSTSFQRFQGRGPQDQSGCQNGQTHEHEALRVSF